MGAHFKALDEGVLLGALGSWIQGTPKLDSISYLFKCVETLPSGAHFIALVTGVLVAP